MRGKWFIAVVFCVAFSWAGAVIACSGGGHIFVALATIERLKKSDNPEARKLARILEKYRWVMCHGAEGPDMVARSRGYQDTHYKSLFNVSYESPQAFDLSAAQLVFTALLKNSYRTNYGLTPDDLRNIRPNLYIAPDPKKREISLAFAAGYVSHLLSDYFCHRPALTWWEKDSIMQEAVKRACPKQKSYGMIQCVYSAFLWKSHMAEYGIAPEMLDAFEKQVDDFKRDNGVLPYCALSCSRIFYTDWRIDAAKFVKPQKYEICARPIIMPGHLSSTVEYDHKITDAIFRETGRSYEENLRIGSELTDWREVYDDVIGMIAKALADAAPEIGIESVDDRNIIADELKVPPPRPISVSTSTGTMVYLPMYLRDAVICAVLRDGSRRELHEMDDVTKAVWKCGWIQVGGRRLFGFAAHPPWATGAGDVYADFRLRLPRAQGVRIVFQSDVSMRDNIRDSDGVTFAIIVIADGERKRIAALHVAEKKWTPFEADITEYAGREITLRLLTSPGQKDNTVRDNAAWGEPKIVIVSQ